MKTIDDWFNGIKDKEIKEAAFGNTSKNKLLSEVESLADAIDGAFEWVESDEGDDYWGEIWDRAIDGENI